MIRDMGFEIYTDNRKNSGPGPDVFICAPMRSPPTSYQKRPARPASAGRVPDLCCGFSIVEMVVFLVFGDLLGDGRCTRS